MTCSFRLFIDQTDIATQVGSQLPTNQASHWCLGDEKNSPRRYGQGRGGRTRLEAGSWEDRAWLGGEDILPDKASGALHVHLPQCSAIPAGWRRKRHETSLPRTRLDHGRSLAGHTSDESWATGGKSMIIRDPDKRDGSLRTDDPRVKNISQVHCTFQESLQGMTLTVDYIVLCTQYVTVGCGGINGSVFVFGPFFLSVDSTALGQFLVFILLAGSTTTVYDTTSSSTRQRPTLHVPSHHL